MSDATMTPAVLPDAELLICVTCKTSLPADSLAANPLADEDGALPGARLYAALMAGALPAGLHVRAVECLSNCTRGCTVALRGGERWSYVYGNLNPDTDAETLRDGAARYLTAADGLVPWRERSQHFRKNCIARIPPYTLTKDAPNV